CGPGRRRRLLPVAVLVVVSAILLLAGGVWWGLQSARGVFDSYMAAIASGDVRQADRLSLGSQKAGLTVAPGRRISRVAVSMRGRDAALVSWSLDGRRQEAIIRARRVGAAYWKVSQGLARKTRISGITADVTVEGHRPVARHLHLHLPSGGCGNHPQHPGHRLRQRRLEGIRWQDPDHLPVAPGSRMPPPTGGGILLYGSPGFHSRFIVSVGSVWGWGVLGGRGRAGACCRRRGGR
ncbi:hypothetical protein HMPREF9017_01070, partial [Parascardovia denticolens F0305]